MATSLTFVNAGTVVSTTTSAALNPVGTSVVAGNLLLLFTAARNTLETVPTPTGWTLLFTTAGAVGYNGLAVFARIATGGGDDAPTVDWTGSTQCIAWIQQYSGDVYPGDLRTLVTNFTVTPGASSGSAPVLPAAGISGTDRMVILFAVKNKTVTGDNATTVTAPAGYTKRQQSILSGTNLVAATAELQQTSPVDYDGTDFTVNGTAESLTSTGLVFAIRTGSTRSTIIAEAVTQHVRTDTTSPQTFSHAGAASGVKGALLAIMHGTSNTDHVSAASYGGVAMTRVQRNTDAATEPGASEWWFLGAGVPQGTNNFSYTPGATTDDIHAVGITLLADDDLIVIDTDGINDNAANPSVNIQTTGRESMAFAALYSGLGDPSNFAENEDCMRVLDNDFGLFISLVSRQIISLPDDIAIGGVSSTDDVAFSVVSVTPVLGSLMKNIVNQSQQAVVRAARY